MGEYTQSWVSIVDFPDDKIPTATLEDGEWDLAEGFAEVDERAGVDRLHVIAGILIQAGYTSVDYGFPCTDQAEILDAIRAHENLTQEEARWDAIENIEDRLLELGVTFEAHFEPKYEWDGQSVCGIPGMGVFTSTANADNSEYTLNADIQRWLDESDTLGAFQRRFEEASGHAYRVALEEICRRRDARQANRAHPERWTEDEVP